MINVKQFARFVVELGDQVAPSDIEEGMRVGSDSFISTLFLSLSFSVMAVLFVFISV